MALQTSGQISLYDIRTELDRTGTISLFDTDVRDLLDPAGITIGLFDAYGKSAFEGVLTDRLSPNITGAGFTGSWYNDNTNQTILYTLDSSGNNQSVYKFNTNYGQDSYNRVSDALQIIPAGNKLSSGRVIGTELLGKRNVQYTDNDGITWANTGSGTGYSFSAVTNNDIVYAINTTGGAAISSNLGSSFTGIGSPVGGAIFDVEYSSVSGLYVIGNSNGTIYTTPNSNLSGVTSRVSVGSFTISSVREVEETGTMVATGYQGSIAGVIISRDGGITWSSFQTISGLSRATDVIFGNGTIILFTNRADHINRFAYSRDDGTTWTVHEAPNIISSMSYHTEGKFFWVFSTNRAQTFA